ncbi:hypothetical protein JZ00_09035 [Pseudomonas frederiksbergensis]|jgi:hypothetical protein|uniref:Uncharacterized protein n=1 Tax=Pseudomonas frederiksbergensis TaxID=104087 RepID=A0A0B1Z2B9_9PSED|nr:hypothetical protein JZ00_09035 [Pseudomonas frederiksbergensis]
MRLGSIAEATALPRISANRAALFGLRHRKEPFGRSRLLACGLVLVGMLVITPETLALDSLKSNKENAV